MPECNPDQTWCSENCNGYKYSDEVEVTCASGTVRGRTVQTCYGPQFVRFAGVPYAEPPVGPLRFLPPVPITRWGSTIDGSKHKSIPFSYDPMTHEFIGSEDSLYITIHTPELKPREQLAVMVWITGWGFCCNDYSYIGAGWLTDENVVVIYVNFRLGPFGFLSIQQATAPGNCGLKDVVVALGWIKGNIAAFGGDPDNVTICGLGSGSSMVHYMMLSPLATGLYQKAIVQTGTALHNWAFSHHPLAAAKALANELKVDTEDMHEAVEELRALPAEEIMRGYAALIDRQEWINMFVGFDAVFKPCVEDEFEGQQAFLTKYPYYLLRTGKFNKIPLMIGSNTHEGKSVKILSNSPLSRTFDKMNIDLSTLVPRELGLEDSSTGSNNLGLRLMRFYVRGDKLTEDNSEDFFNFMSDYYFTYFTNRCVKAHAKYATSHPIYYYILEALSDLPWPTEFKELQDSGGEFNFLFQMYSCSEYSGGVEASRVRRKMLRLWTNFAKCGNPTPDNNDKLFHVTWEPVADSERLQYFSIGQNLTKGCNPYYERMSFWDTVLDDTACTRIATFFDKI